MQKYDQIPLFMWKLTGREKEKKNRTKKIYELIQSNQTFKTRTKTKNKKNCFHRSNL